LGLDGDTSTPIPILTEGASDTATTAPVWFAGIVSSTSDTGAAVPNRSGVIAVIATSEAIRGLTIGASDALIIKEILSFGTIVTINTDKRTIARTHTDLLGVTPDRTGGASDTFVTIGVRTSRTSDASIVVLVVILVGERTFTGKAIRDTTSGTLGALSAVPILRIGTLTNTIDESLTTSASERRRGDKLTGAVNFLL
jgi:hypothetical protein